MNRPRSLSRATGGRHSAASCLFTQHARNCTCVTPLSGWHTVYLNKGFDWFFSFIPLPKLIPFLGQSPINASPSRFSDSYTMASSSHTPPTGTVVHQLVVKPIFDALELKDKLYAHHMARACWNGIRIVMQQVSSESPHIFDFIMDLYHACGGQWSRFTSEYGVTSEEMQSFLEYAGTFLCNLGNYHVRLSSLCCLLPANQLGQGEGD